jgi:hypothetical protein
VDYDLYRTFGDVSLYLADANFAIAFLTNTGCIFLCLCCCVWWWKLLGSPTTDLGWWFFGTAVLAVALWSWSLKGMQVALDPKRGLPSDTLYERIGIMLAIWIKLWIATRRKPMPRWGSGKPREMRT